MLYIKVLDRFNKPLKGRTVRIESTGFAGNSTKTTNENGDVEFNMRPGNFRVRVTNQDFGVMYLTYATTMLHVS